MLNARHALPVVPSAPTVSGTAHGQASASSITVTIPASVGIGDFMMIGVLSLASTVATPAGWNKNTTVASAPVTVYLFWRNATAGDVGGSTTVSFTGGSTIMQYVFMSAANPNGPGLDTLSVGNTGNSSNNTFTIGSLTTLNANCLVFELVAIITEISGTTTLTAPTTIQVQDKFTGTCTLAFCTQLQVSPGATGTNAATFSNTGTANNNWLYIKNGIDP